MNRRIPLLVAVVGALLVGGATTGTTRATWNSQANLQAASVSSATMNLGASASPTSLSVERGSSSTTRVTVNDTSSSNAKNLRQRVTLALSGSLPTGVTATLIQATANGCGTGAQGAVDLTPGGSFATCIRVAATAASTATSATINLNYSGAQVRGGTVGGWTTAAKTVSVPVTLSILPPVLSCSPGLQSDGTYEISWPAVGGATGYRVYSSSNGNNWDLAVTKGVNDRWARATIPAGNTTPIYVRVTTVGSSSESQPSNVLRIRRASWFAPITCQDMD